jgi:uncharacterized membrane protein
MRQVILYYEPGDAASDQTRADLEGLRREFPFELTEIDANADPAMRRKLGGQFPVVQIGPYTLRPPFTAVELRVTLGATKGRASDAPRLEGAKLERTILADRVVLSFARHWLVVFNLLVFLYVGVPFLAPVLMKLGATGPANLIYLAYRPLCHQLGFRSWFLFGMQPAYPRVTAGTDLIPYGVATGLDENDLWSARTFIGNPQLGYKVAFCQRDVAIYGGILLAGLVFALVRRRVKPLPIWAWLVVGILPIALDGGTQMLGAFSIFASFARESTPFLRTVTGILFGVTTVWMAYPYLEESMGEVIATVLPKLAAADRRTRPHATGQGQPPQPGT